MMVLWYTLYSVGKTKLNEFITDNSEQSQNNYMILTGYIEYLIE